MLIATEGLKPSAFNAARVRRSGGKITVVDGPFTEAKELIAGFVLVEVPSKQAAIELTERFLEIAGEAAAEVRDVFDSPHAVLAGGHVVFGEARSVQPYGDQQG